MKALSLVLEFLGSRNTLFGVQCWICPTLNVILTVYFENSVDGNVCRELYAQLWFKHQRVEVVAVVLLWLWSYADTASQIRNNSWLFWFNSLQFNRNIFNGSLYYETDCDLWFKEGMEQLFTGLSANAFRISTLRVFCATFCAFTCIWIHLSHNSIA